MKYFDLIQPSIDKNGVITQGSADNFDGGDTAQREGMFAFAASILHKLGKMDDAEYNFCTARYAKVISLLRDPNHNGLIRRYPDLPFWGAYSDRLSRDQSTSNVVAMGCVDRSALKDFFWGHIKAGGLLLLTNTRVNGSYPGDANYKWKLPDITIMSFHGLYIRAFRAWPLYPLLWLTDLEILANSLIKVLSYAINQSNNDDLSHLIGVYQSELSMPTPISKLAKWVYKFRKYPANAGDAKNAAQATMNAYFSVGPALNLVYKEINDYFWGT